jgi:hypothetical protein
MAMAAWNAYVSDNGADSTRNPVGGGWMERTAKPIKAAKTCSKDLQRVPYWTAAVRRKVNATVKNNPVCTVSGGGWMEKTAKPIKVAKTYSGYRIGRPL